MNEQPDPRWLQLVRDQLNEGTRDLDAATASQLNRARQRALDAGLRPKRRLPWLWAGMATAAVLVLTLTITLRAPERAPPVPMAAERAVDDFDLLAGAEELEMIENLEFYAWLEQQSLDG